MGIFHCFFKNKLPTHPVHLKCTACDFEYNLSPREVRRLERKNARDPVCPVKIECHICHTGLMIPLLYTNPEGKLFRYHDLKPKIKNLDPNTLLERIYSHPDSIPLNNDD
jgi:hypothetical protein